MTMHGSPPNNKKIPEHYNSCASTTSLETELQVDLCVAVVAVDQTLLLGRVWLALFPVLHHSYRRLQYK